jgi:hypothetical protein
MQPLPLSIDGQVLSKNLQAAAATPSDDTTEKLHIAGVGAGLYAAYEKLRNAAEYTEQHLLLRAAIERFLRRNILFRGSASKLGHELVVELTEAGYLKNNQISLTTVGQVDDFIAQYVQLAKTIEKSHDVAHDKARRWTLQVLSVCIEKLLSPHRETDAFIDFTFKHFQSAIDREHFGIVPEQEFQNALYCAVHRALFKSDIATIRFYLMVRLSEQDMSTAHFVAVCNIVDELFQGRLTNRLTRLVSRHGAPLRTLRELIMTEQNPTAVLASRQQLLTKLRTTIEKLYDRTHSRLLKGVIRAIIFVFITKMIIGLGIEVPYDLVVIGTVAPLPLLINMLFPPLYMATAGWGIGKPGRHNTEAIISHVDRMLYQTNQQPVQYRPQLRVDSQGLRTSFNIVYGLAFIISFGLAVLALHALEFTVVHGVVFFIFFSAVSFLRFRLIQSARELELVDNRQSLGSTIADFFYTPFIRLGMWLSDQYRQVNIISILLDFAIELPLKTSLRLIRQWASFMRDKREEL